MLAQNCKKINSIYTKKISFFKFMLQSCCFFLLTIGFNSYYVLIGKVVRKIITVGLMLLISLLIFDISIFIR